MKQAIFTPEVMDLGKQNYTETWHKMQDYTLSRQPYSKNQIWLVEHPPIFTLGRTGKASSLLTKSTVPMLKVDRGGDMTYHGPGQFIAYLLFDIRRDGIGIRNFVRLIEQSTINYLATLSVTSERKKGHPGIYTEFGKIAALGLNCKQHGTYHGMSLNVNMDLTPFQQIKPCGSQQAVTQLQKWHPDITLEHPKKHWVENFLRLWQHRCTLKKLGD